MFALVLTAMLATSAPTDPGIGNPGLDRRAPHYTMQSREQISERPADPLPGPREVR